MKRDCDTCAYRGPQGCSAWECEYISRDDAIEAYKTSVVRCRDCRYNYGRKSPECFYAQRVLKDEDFCSYGERRA